jgi:hypothetical protein
LVNLGLVAGDPAAIDAATQQPVHGAVAVIGPLIAVLAERSAELRDDSNYGIAPFTAQLLCERREPLAQAVDVVGQRALGASLVDMSIPSTSDRSP